MNTEQARKVVRDIYAELLGVEVTRDEDDFFELGGHSMLAVIVTADLSDRLGFEVPLRMIFDNPAVGALADALRGLAEQLPAQD